MQDVIDKIVEAKVETQKAMVAGKDVQQYERHEEELWTELSQVRKDISLTLELQQGRACAAHCLVDGLAHRASHTHPRHRCSSKESWWPCYSLLAC